MKKELRRHRKDERRVLWQASRLEGKVKNVGIKAKKKQKKKKVNETRA